jgi:uncharacterized protein YjdB
VSSSRRLGSTGVFALALLCTSCVNSVEIGTGMLPGHDAGQPNSDGGPPITDGGSQTTDAGTPAPTALSLLLSPSSTRLFAGAAQQFVVTGVLFSDGSIGPAPVVSWSSNDTTVATVDQQGLATGVKLGNATVSAIAGGLRGTASVDVVSPPAVALSLVLSPTSTKLSVGASQRFSVTGTLFSDGSVGPAPAVSWSSSDASVANVDQQGLVTADSVGNATLTASAGSLEGTASVEVDPLPPVAVSLVLSPSSTKLFVGATQQFFVAGVLFSDGSIGQAPAVSWSSNDPTVATISQQGLANAVKSGNATLTASAGNLRGTASIEVDPPPAVALSLLVSPPATNLIVGATQQFSVTGVLFSDGSTGAAPAVSWNSADATVATIDQQGLVTAAKIGNTTLTASAGSLRGTARVEVDPPPPVAVSLVLLPSSTKLLVGATQQFFVAGVLFSDGSIGQAPPVSWSSNDPTVATISQQGLANAVKSGNATLTASAGTLRGTASIEVDPPPAVALSLLVSPPATNLIVGATHQFSVTGVLFSDGSTGTPPAVSWSSADATVATIDQQGLVTAAKIGNTTLTASAGSLRGTARVEVDPPPPVAVSLVLSPSSTKLFVGATQQFFVSGVLFSDGSIGQAPAVSWSSSDATVATVSTQGLASAVKVGTTTLTASAGNLRGTASVEVDPPPAVALALLISPSSTKALVGTTVQFAVTGSIFSDGSIGPAPAASWISSDPSVATIDQQGLVATLKVGNVTLTASAGNLRGTASLEVAPPPVVAVSLVIAPSSAKLLAGATQRFSVSGVLFSDGSIGPAPVVSWRSSDATVATVDPQGLVTAVKVGIVTLTASAGNLRGTAIVEVDPLQLVTLVISPSYCGLTVGLGLQLEALGSYADGSSRNVTTQVSWSSSATTFATVNTAGYVLAVAQGAANITATLGGVTAQLNCALTTQRFMFTTSKIGTGNLSSWPDADGGTGLAAADAICNNLAEGAALPGTYIAWLSDSHDDVFCRVQQLRGKRSANCNQHTLPNAAGPWVRTDGLPMAATLSDLLVGNIIYPPADDENGTIGGLTDSFGDNDQDGGLLSYPGDCQDWTGAGGDYVTIGSTEQTGGNWDTAYTGPCSSRRAIACFGVGPGMGPPLANYRQSGKTIFATRTLGNGNLGSWPLAGGKTGIAAGDAICQASAQAAGLTGTFLAWLGTSSVTAASRLSGDGPWVRTDGALIARNRAQLLSGTLETSNAFDEHGRDNLPNIVWTGALRDGTSGADNCSGWTSTGTLGIFGITFHADYAWTANYTQGCSTIGSVYCVQQ